MRYPRASHQQRLQITLRVMFLIMQSYRLILGNNDVYFFVFRPPVSISQRGRETISHICNLPRLSRVPMAVSQVTRRLWSHLTRGASIPKTRGLRRATLQCAKYRVSPTSEASGICLSVYFFDEAPHLHSSLYGESSGSSEPGSTRLTFPSSAR